MKKITLVIVTILVFAGCKQEGKRNYIFTQDVDNYWKAYDKIVKTQDTVLQLQYLKEEFIDKASIGQKKMFEVRNYMPKEYLDNITNYPKFWNSIRENTLKSKFLGEEIEKGVTKLKEEYPELSPAKVYFTIGGFRSSGTTLDSLVLIGTEMALANENIDVSEFPQELNYVKNYSKINPFNDVEFLNVHEFIHTQQKDGRGSNLLVQCIREGIAEFLAEKVLEKESIMNAIAYGKLNSEKIKNQFKKEMFNEHYSYWLWSQYENEFNERDLGYYVGYAIADKFYNKEKDKKKSIKELIELDFNNSKTIEDFVDNVNYFNKSLKELNKEYIDMQPKVVSIQPFKNGSIDLEPGKQVITITFSEAMDTRFRGFDYGPLGEKNVLLIQKYIGFSDDGKSVVIEVDLLPNKQYQMTLTNRFTNSTGTELVPYLIDVRTKH